MSVRKTRVSSQADHARDLVSDDLRDNSVAGDRANWDGLEPSAAGLSPPPAYRVRLTRKRSLARTQPFAFERCSNLAEPLCAQQTPVWKLVA